MRSYSFFLMIVLVVVLLGACKPKQLPINIINLNDAQGIRKYTTIYALPKTVVRVNLKVEKTTYKKGPYHQYANSYLGLNNIIDEDGQKWRIADVDFETYAIADTNNLYLIEMPDELSGIEIKLTKDGLLEAFCPEKMDAIDVFGKKEPLSVLESRIFSSNTRSTSEELSFDDVPLPKNLVSKNSTSEEAAFLSNQILTLRDDRAAILVGDGYTETMPADEALKIMISSIDKIQEKYISMFKGKTKKDTLYYSFDYVPIEPRKKTQSILFRFSEQFGIVENTDVSGMPMIIELESCENLKQYELFKKRQVYLKKLASKKEKEEVNGLFYRIPEIVDARLMVNDNILGQKKIQVVQFGSIHSLPVKYLDGNYKVEFYPELGSLKSIVKKENKDFEKKK